MKLLVVAAALLVVCVSADEQCSELEKVKVKHQWYEAYGTGHARLLLGLRVWNKCVHVLRFHRSLLLLFFNAHWYFIPRGLEICKV